MQQRRRPALRLLAAPVVAQRRGDVGVAQDAPHHPDVDAGVEQVRGGRSSEVVRRAGGQPSLAGALAEDAEDGLLGEAPPAEPPAAIDREEQRAVCSASEFQPAVERRDGTGRQVDQPLLVPLAVDGQRLAPPARTRPGPG